MAPISNGSLHRSEANFPGETSRAHNVAAVSIWMGAVLTDRLKAVIASDRAKYGALEAMSETAEFTGHLVWALYHDAKLAEKINALAGKKVITDTTIWKLRTAQEDNPRTQTLEWLARGLGVRTGAYFTDDDVARAVDEQLELADAIAETFANDRRLGLLQRADGLSAKSLAALIQMADTFRDLEHLDDEEPPRTSARPCWFSSAMPRAMSRAAPGPCTCAGRR